MDAQHYQRNGQRGNHFGSIIVYSKPLVHNPMPASHNYITNGSTQRAKGYDAWITSKGKEENAYANYEEYFEDRSDEKVFGVAEVTDGYSNMRHAADKMVVKNQAFIEDEYADEHEKVFAASEATKGYVNTKHAGRDQYGNKIYAAEAGRGYMNLAQGSTRRDEPIYALNPVLSDAEYGHKMYSAEAGRGYMNGRQEARRREDTMFALNPALIDDGYTVYSTPTALPFQGYANMQHGVKENMFVSNRAFGRADLADEVYYKPSHRMEPTSMRKVVAWGPWGENTGNLFDDGVFTGIREIQLTRSGGIVSIKVCYDMEGKAVWGSKNGGSHGLKVDKIVLDYPSEYLTDISGYYGAMILRGGAVLKSLTFHTNVRKYGPFGDEQGISFTSAGPKKGKIVGFNGRIKNWYVESIGVHVMEATQPGYDAFNMSSMRMRLEC